MAAITPVRVTDDFFVIRKVLTQATTGQTDWLDLPSTARSAQIVLNLTAVAGTTPTVTPSFQIADPVALTDTSVINFAEHAALTAISTANLYVFDLGPGITGIANDVTNSATVASAVQLNGILPELLGVKILNFRGSSDETYSYNLSIKLIRGS